MDISEFITSPHPFFVGVCQEYLRMLANSAMQTHFAAGTTIFLQGDIANRFYLIQRGKVLLQSRVNGRPPFTIQTMGAGDVLGWSWLFPPFQWHFDAWAEEDTDAIFLYGTLLREACESDKAFGYEMIKRMSETVVHRLQATRMRLINTAIADPRTALPTEG